MKQAFRLTLCTLGVLCAWLWGMLSMCKPDQPAAPCYSPDYVESYTVGSFDRLQIQKIYCLIGNDTPSRIPTEDFQQYGRNFSMIELGSVHIRRMCGFSSQFSPDARQKFAGVLDVRQKFLTPQTVKLAEKPCVSLCVNRP